MTVHLYFLPVQRVFDPKPARGPKYLKWLGNTDGVDCEWRMLDYGHIGVALVAADTTLALHQAAFDQPDVLSIDPRNGNQRDLDANATTAEVNALTSYLDTAGNFVPMNWATTSDTRRQILRGICGIFLFVQRLTAVSSGASPKDWGISLSTEISELSTEQRQWMLEAIADLRLSDKLPPESWSIRRVLRFLGNNWTDPIDLGLITI